MTTHSVRQMLAADRDDTAGVLATAFLQDPMMQWLSGVEDAERRMAATARGFFGPALEIGLCRGHSYLAPGAGAAIWSPPDVPMITEAEGATIGQAIVAHFGVEGAGRLGALAELVRAHHPHDRPHFYLFVLGAAVQGAGLGATLLAPVLARCDADGLGAYLESSNPRNVSFYERQGFRVTWQGRPDEPGPLIHGMWREPVGARP